MTDLENKLAAAVAEVARLTDVVERQRRVQDATAHERFDLFDARNSFSKMRKVTVDGLSISGHVFNGASGGGYQFFPQHLPDASRAELERLRAECAVIEKRHRLAVIHDDRLCQFNYLTWTRRLVNDLEYLRLRKDAEVLSEKRPFVFVRVEQEFEPKPERKKSIRDGLRDMAAEQREQDYHIDLAFRYSDTGKELPLWAIRRGISFEQSRGEKLFHAIGGGAMIKGVIRRPSWSKQPQNIKDIHEKHAVNAPWAHSNGGVYAFREDGSIYSWITGTPSKYDLPERTFDPLPALRDKVDDAKQRQNSARAGYSDITLREAITGWDWKKGKNGILSDISAYDLPSIMKNAQSEIDRYSELYRLRERSISAHRMAAIEVKEGKKK